MFHIKNNQRKQWFLVQANIPALLSNLLSGNLPPYQQVFSMYCLTNYYFIVNKFHHNKAFSTNLCRPILNGYMQGGFIDGWLFIGWICESIFLESEFFYISIWKFSIFSSLNAMLCYFRKFDILSNVWGHGPLYTISRHRFAV